MIFNNNKYHNSNIYNVFLLKKQYKENENTLDEHQATLKNDDVTGDAVRHEQDDDYEHENVSTDDESEEECRLEKKQKLFTSIDATELQTTCKSIIRSGPISTERVKTALQATKRGSSILHRYNILQIQTRLKYERRKTQLNN